LALSSLCVYKDVDSAGTDAGSDDDHEMIETNRQSHTAEEQSRDDNGTGVPATSDDNPIQVQLDDVDDLPDVNSAEAAHISGVR